MVSHTFFLVYQDFGRNAFSFNLDSHNEVLSREKSTHDSLTSSCFPTSESTNEQLNTWKLLDFGLNCFLLKG